ncbi:DUF2157 domain-containing protein [Piscinibacter sp.]|uniref:DUF2157 domain-containing protein n=1 Tax=Piscinibacter sp. TaxID=1903157 RepID=UPI002B79C9B2|nr:DUF2157 domain-containing protein [Albitalea sp.]HUG24535.1 DUF2157 domain-containing protein [Albitalea sp.]
MDVRLALYELVQRHALDRRATGELLRLAGLAGEPSALALRLRRGTAGLAAALVGLGTIFWIAANWDVLSRFGHFALLQGLVALTCAAALWRPAARAPLALLALLATGGLFAYFGQTYQTGADPWQLFALWAVLALPLAVAVRSDLLWTPWAAVAMAAVSLWVHAHTGHQWRVAPHDLPVHFFGWAAALAVVAALSPAASRLTGAGPWAWRTALTLSAVMITATALGGLFHREVAPHYGLALLLLASAAAALSLARFFDAYGLSAVALALNTLLVAGLARVLFDGGGDPVGRLLILGLAAAALLAATVSAVLRLSRRMPPPRGAAV